MRKSSDRRANNRNQDDPLRNMITDPIERVNSNPSGNAVHGLLTQSKEFSDMPQMLGVATYNANSKFQLDVGSYQLQNNDSVKL